MKIAPTPIAPYYAVIFTSIKNNNDSDNYNITADRMVELASQQKGYLGHESGRNELGITVSYWKDLEAIRNWKKNSEHLLAQKDGRNK